MDFIRLIFAHHRRLLRKQLATGDTGIIAVGVGWPSKDGKPDLRRGVSLIYLVRKKKKRLPQKQRVHRQIPLTIFPSTTGNSKHRKKRRTITMFTDIIEIPKPATLTGADIAAGGEEFTAGAVVTWGPAGVPCYGLISVGHGVANLADGQVTITAPAQSSFMGNVYAQTDTNDALDACLIQISAANVQSCLGITLPAAGAPACVVRSVTDLIDDAKSTHPLGYSLNVGDSKIFTISAFFPQANQQNPLISGCPNRTNLLLTSGNPNEFHPGTSGSVWIGGGGVVDGLQIAGFPTQYERGVGQPMVDYLGWANRQVGGNLQLIDVF